VPRRSTPNPLGGMDIEPPSPTLVRALTRRESELLSLLLTEAGANGAIYLSQVGAASVVGACDCGCATVDLAVGGRRADPVLPEEIVSDGQGVDDRGNPVGVLVFARDGLLSCLEIYSQSDAREVGLPAIKSMALP
jgi:hypothetical protein